VTPALVQNLSLQSMSEGCIWMTFAPPGSGAPFTEYKAEIAGRVRDVYPAFMLQNMPVGEQQVAVWAVNPEGEGPKTIKTVVVKAVDG